MMQRWDFSLCEHGRGVFRAFHPGRAALRAPLCPPGARGPLAFQPPRHSAAQARDRATTMRARQSDRQLAMSRRAPDKRKRRSRSGDRGSPANFSDFLNRGFSLRGSRASAGSLADLSMDAGSPGVLKVFGESLQAGAAYKSILVSARSKANEVVGEVLERYGVSRRVADQFVLCDAVGKLSSASKAKGGLSIFTEEYNRQLGPGEQVVTVQCLWRAAPGLHRRLEIRRRAPQDSASPEDSHASSGYHSDNETRGINESARKWARAKLPSEVRHSLFLAEEAALSGPPPPECREAASQTADPPQPPRHPPRLGPHLLLLRGMDSAADRPLLELSDSNLIGRDSRCDIALPAAEDVCPEHCVIRTADPLDPGPCRVLLVDPCSPGATEVAVNGRPLRGPTPLEPGDLLNVGRHYVFIYKDGSDSELRLPWLPRPRRLPAASASFRSSRGTSCRSRRASAASSRAPRPQSAASRLGEVRCDWMVTQLLDTESDAEPVWPEFAACLLSMLVRHLGSDPELKEELQWQCSERVCSLCQRAQVVTGQAGLSESARSVGSVVRACAVNFECFLHFKTAPEGGAEAKEWRTFFEALATQTLDDAVKCLAEEAVSTSTALFHDNQFSGHPPDDVPLMDGFLDFLDLFLKLFEEIVSPSAKLLKSTILKKLMIVVSQQALQTIISDRENCRWSRGVQLRANLDCFEDWIRDNSLHEISDFIAVLENTVDLLATPKTQLMTMSWRNLRASFPFIPISVLRFLLENYEGGRGALLVSWIPSQDDEVEAEYDPVCALEDLFHYLQQDNRLLDRAGRSLLDMSRLANQFDFTSLVRTLSKNLREKGATLTWLEVLDAFRSSELDQAASVPNKDSAYSSAVSQRCEDGHTSPPALPGEDWDSQAASDADSISTLEAVEPIRLPRDHHTPPIRSSADDSDAEDIFVAALTRNESGSLGLGVVDGQMTALDQPGIYVRSLVTGGMAERDGRLQLGDRILAVNGRSLVGLSYEQAMDLIRNGTSPIQLLIAKSDLTTAMKVIASYC